MIFIKALRSFVFIIRVQSSTSASKWYQVIVPISCSYQKTIEFSFTIEILMLYTLCNILLLNTHKIIQAYKFIKRKVVIKKKYDH